MEPDGIARKPLYRHRLIAPSYDVLNAVLWLPGGSARLRRRFVDSLAVRSGDRVLELGCGTGLVTRHLVALGAQVTAVDRAPAMLAAAQRRARGASFVRGDVGTAAVGGPFERVVLAFILHELAPSDRVDVLQRSASVLAPGGWIGILEWARPPGCLRSRAWATTVRAIEPPVAADVLDRGLDDALASAGLRIRADLSIAGGRARIIHAAVPR